MVRTERTVRGGQRAGSLIAADVVRIRGQRTTVRDGSGFEYTVATSSVKYRQSFRDAHPELFMRENPSHGSVDTVAARELALFAINDADLYRQRITPVIENLRKKMRKGIYKHDLAFKLWKYVADDAAKRYNKEFSGTTKGYGSFNVPTREAAAREIRLHYNDAFDGMMRNNPKKIKAHVIVDEDTGMNKWHLPGRFTVGSWRGPAPRGGVNFPMGQLDLHSGEYSLHGPKGILPNPKGGDMAPTKKQVFNEHFMQNEEARLLPAMERVGGGFASALAKAWSRADSGNRRILRDGFWDLLQSFSWAAEQDRGLNDNPKRRRRAGKPSRKQIAARKRFAAMARKRGKLRRSRRHHMSRKVRHGYSSPDVSRRFHGLPIHVQQKNGKAWQTVASFAGTPAGIKRAMQYAKKWKRHYGRVAVRVVDVR